MLTLRKNRYTRSERKKIYEDRTLHPFLKTKFNRKKMDENGMENGKKWKEIETKWISRQKQISCDNLGASAPDELQERSDSCIHVFIHVFIHSFIHVFIHSFVYS